MRRAGRRRWPGLIAIVGIFWCDAWADLAGFGALNGVRHRRTAGVLPTFGPAIPLARPRNAPPHGSVTQNAHFDA